MILTRYIVDGVMVLAVSEADARRIVRGPGSEPIHGGGKKIHQAPPTLRSAS